MYRLHGGHFTLSCKGRLNNKLHSVDISKIPKGHILRDSHACKSYTFFNPFCLTLLYRFLNLFYKVSINPNSGLMRALIQSIVPQIIKSLNSNPNSSPIQIHLNSHVNLTFVTI